jgi:uncharacterized phage protein (TIGR01671 family)
MDKRAYKFRAWEGGQFSKMEYNVTIMNDKDWLCYDDAEIKGRILMQFTGLLDKNGKEIYEGDIVDSKLYDGTRKNYVVEYRDGSFVIGLTELGKWIEDVIVIGNIYENPNLLEDK